MVAEGLVDVFQTIKNLRIQRPAMVQTLVSTIISLPIIYTYYYPLYIIGAVSVLLYIGS